MSTRIRSIFISIALFLVAPVLMAQSGNPFIGSWEVDLRSSNFGSATPPQDLVRTYFDHGDDTYTYMVITTGQDGTVSGTTSHYSYSGDNYPIANFNQDIRAQISYNKINDTTVEYTVYVNGEAQQIGAKFISPNYQQLTISIQFPNSDQDDQILVFNRR